MPACIRVGLGRGKATAYQARSRVARSGVLARPWTPGCSHAVAIHSGPLLRTCATRRAGESSKAVALPGGGRGPTDGWWPRVIQIGADHYGSSLSETNLNSPPFSRAIVSSNSAPTGST